MPPLSLIDSNARDGDASAIRGGHDAAPRRRSWRLALFPVLVLVFVLAFVQLPYFVLSPGPSRDVEQLIRIARRPTYPSNGHFLLTAVRFTQATAYGVFAAWIDDTRSVVPEREFLRPGQSAEELYEISLSEMDTSKLNAAFVALSTFTDYPKQHRPGVLVDYVFPGTPADGKLFPGDLIVAIDGEPIASRRDVSRRLAAAGYAQDVSIEARAGGESRTVVVRTARLRGARGPAIGFVPIPNFPFPLEIESGEIGGPSAGLMWTLGLAELLTRRDLTGGRTIAGTGTIDLDGNVGPIGGVEEKVVAAERAGAQLFFAPIDDAPAARAVARRMTIVPVRTFADALRYLRAAQRGS